VPTTLLIGETTAVQGNRYLQVSGRPQVYVVSSGLFDDANLTPEQFRDTQLVRFDSWLVDELALTSPHLAFAVQRLGRAWHLTKPFQDVADTNEVRTVLTNLSGITITRFVEEAPQVEQLSTWGFDHPQAEVTVRQAGERPLAATLFFGNPLPDDASLVFAKRSDEPTLYAVPASAVETLLKDPQGLRAKICFEFFTFNVTKLALSREGSSWTIGKGDDGTWKAEGTDTVLETAKVGDLLKRLADLRLIEFVDEKPSDLARYGLEPPFGTLSIWVTGEEVPQRLLVGSTLEGATERYGRIEGRQPVVKLPATITDLLGTTIESLRQADHITETQTSTEAQRGTP
jgi:hypothetical protein